MPRIDRRHANTMIHEDNKPLPRKEATNGSAQGVIDRVFQDRGHERRIDYVFLGSPHDSRRRACVWAARVVLDKPESGVWASDHYAVYAEIEVRPRNQ